jgi:hypothetical protein
MKLTKFSTALIFAILLTASSTQAELKRVEMSVFGMD